MMAGHSTNPSAALAGPGASSRSASVSALGPSSRAVKVPAAKPKATGGTAAPSNLMEFDISQLRVSGGPSRPRAGSTKKADVGVLETLSQPEAYVIADIQGFCTPRSDIDSQLRAYVEHFVRCKESCAPLSCHRERSNALLARELTAKGYTVAIRQHPGSSNAQHHPPAGATAASSPTVRDTYIAFSGVSGNPGEEYVIELDFRDRFNIGSPTAFYNTCLSVVPEVWVGPLDQLLPLVELLCAEMSMAFNQCDLDMPPWRYHDNVVSRWISPELKSFSVDSGASMADSSPDQGLRGMCHSHGGGSSALSSMDDMLVEAGITLTPLQMQPRTCSLSFDKIEPLAATVAGGGLKKTTSLLGIHLLSRTSPLTSPTTLAQKGRRLSHKETMCT
mmetsp:Transcript_34982/g.99149  ORF Transcript_34982/g.99149 Transcript_34982/m.99149 type:complete len:390 (+) Transcript_34982:516-1685(+)